jgi:hypothetical protein
VSGSGDDVTVLKGGRGEASSNKDAHVTHVCHQHRTTSITDLAEPGVVQAAGIATHACKIINMTE